MSPVAIPFSLVLILATSPIAAQIPFGTADSVDQRDGLRQVVAADIDGDGDPDLVGTAPGADQVFWIENLGSSWSASLLHSAGTVIDGAFGLAIGDMNQDGTLDVVAGARDDGELNLWRNFGGAGPTWSRLTLSNTAPGIRDVALGDLDLDGDLDIVAAVTGAGDLVWWEQTVTTWVQRTLESSATGAREIALADVDGDGDLDVVASIPNDTVAWWDNPRSTTAAWTKQSVGSVVDPVGLAAGDIDRDGDVDVVVGERDDDSVVRWSNPGDGARGTWTATLVGSAGDIALPSALDLLDVDSDGDLDLVVGSGAAGQAAWYEWDAASTSFVARSLPNSGTRVAWTSADTDSDGDADLIAVETNESGDDEILVIANETTHRSARFGAEDFVPTGFVTGQLPRYTRGDVDGDGDTDIVFSQGNDGGVPSEVYWLSNPSTAVNGLPFFTAVPVGAAGQSPHTVSLSRGLTLADFDRDGDQDLLLGEQGSFIVFADYCENLDGSGGDWSCSLRTPLASQGGAEFDITGPLASGDINGDGWPDFVAPTRSVQGTLSFFGLHWFENLGDMSTLEAFEAHQITNDSTGVGSVELADLDADGDLDVIANSTSTATPFFNNGDGSSWTEGSDILQASYFAVGDIDLDGQLDVVRLNSAARIEWLRGDAGTWAVADFANPVVDLDDPDPNISLKGAYLDLADLDGDGDLDILSTFSVSETVVPDIITRPGLAYWVENRIRETGDSRDIVNEGDEAWVYHPLLASDRERVFGFDSTGDGKAEFHLSAPPLLFGFPNTGGSLGTQVPEQALRGTVSVPLGAATELASFELRHAGRSGDDTINALDLRLAWTDDSGTALTQSQVDHVLSGNGRFVLAEDDGDGVFSDSDAPLAMWPSVTIDALGEVVLDITAVGGDLSLDCCESKTVFVVLQPSETALDGSVALPPLFELSWGGTVFSAEAVGFAVDVEPLQSGERVFELVVGSSDVLFSDGFESGDTGAWQ